MACTVSTGRYTSKDIVIQFLPCGVAAAHVQELYFHADVSAGTFKLRVNGELTAAITFSETEATLAASINTALDNLALLAPGDIVATSPGADHFTLTAIANKWYTIIVEADALTGNATDEPNTQTVVTTQGSTTYTLSAQISKFSYEVKTDTTDVTAISEYEETQIPVKETMTFDISLFDAEEDWLFAVRSGRRGIFSVYPKGKIVGYRYFEFYGLIDTLSPDFPDHDVVEKTISGMRQGAMVTDFDSIYAG